MGITLYALRITLYQERRMGKYFVNEYQSKEIRRIKYQLARIAGINVAWSRRIRNWTTPHWELFMKTTTGEDVKICDE